MLSVAKNSWADRPFYSSIELEKWGFKRATPNLSFSANALTVAAPPLHLPFPIKLEQTSEQFGAVMHQLQDYTSPAYFHGGLDIHGQKNQEVLSPIFGKVEAGYYSYTDTFDGRSTKYFLPYREALEKNDIAPWSIYYFEVAVIDRNGYRFEFHHIDPNNLPITLQQKILNGGSVAPGEVLGHLIDWPRTLFGRRYHHVHYNVIHPDGTFINPFFVSEPVNDSLPPTIVNVYATASSRCGSIYHQLIPFTENIPQSTQDHIVIEAYDKITEGQAKHTPALVTAEFKDGTSFSWDFTKRLSLPNGELPNITHMYLYYLCDHRNFLEVATKNFRFYIKIPIPPNYSGPAKISVGDFVGNTSQQTVYIQ